MKTGTELTKENDKYIQLDADIISPHYVKDSEGNIREVKYDNVIFIRKTKELSKFRDEVNAGNNFAGWTIIQVSDIDMSTECSDIIGSWTPIGISEDYCFSGNYDGNNHKISNIYIYEPEKNYIGLFGRTENATIKEVNIGNGSIEGNQYIGSIVGHSKNSIIHNCSNACHVKANSNNAGGIAGGAIDTTIQKCNNSEKIQASNNCGGITGPLGKNVKIQECYNVGEIVANGSNAGGIVAGTWGGENLIIENSYNTGKITVGGSNVGGIIGTNASMNTIVSNSYNTGVITSSVYNAGGIVGVSESNTIIVQRCYNSGIIQATANCGGIGGAFSGTTGSIIQECYNIGEVTITQHNVGGILGGSWNGNSEVIKTSYNIGKIKANGDNAAGIMGVNASLNLNLNNCYNIGEISGRRICIWNSWFTRFRFKKYYNK